jgi:hypothetical protein
VRPGAGGVAIRCARRASEIVQSLFPVSAPSQRVRHSPQVRCEHWPSTPPQQACESADWFGSGAVPNARPSQPPSSDRSLPLSSTPPHALIRTQARLSARLFRAVLLPLSSFRCGVGFTSAFGRLVCCLSGAYSALTIFISLAPGPASPRVTHIVAVPRANCARDAARAGVEPSLLADVGCTDASPSRPQRTRCQAEACRRAVLQAVVSLVRRPPM